MNLNVIRLGRVDYHEALALQLALQQEVMNGFREDTLLLLEHPSILTMGLRGREDHLLVDRSELKDMGIEVVKTKRGGDVTYLGPGQIVGYFISNLKQGNRDIHAFVQQIEKSFVNLLKNNFDIDSTIGEKKYTGVFVGDNKIAAIGFGVSHGVTMHGFAFNFNTDLSHFDWIIPCGLHDKGVTSIKNLTGVDYDRARVESWLLNALADNMGYNLVLSDVATLTKTTVEV